MLENLSHINIFISWGVTFFTGILGIIVGYAKLKQQLKSFIHEFEIYKDTATAAAAAATIVAGEQLVTIKERVLRVESKQEAQVGYDRCRDMRDDCSQKLAKQINDLSIQVNENRQIVTTALQDIYKFIGRIDSHILLNGKNK